MAWMKQNSSVFFVMSVSVRFTAVDADDVDVNVDVALLCCIFSYLVTWLMFILTFVCVTCAQRPG